MTFLLVTRTAAELAAQDLTEYRTRCIALVDEHVDARARALGYKDAVSCVSYCGSTVAQWAAEAATFSAWRDAVWLAVIVTGGAMTTRKSLVVWAPSESVTVRLAKNSPPAA